MAIKINDKDHIQGDENAKIELVEYGDYECPYCGEAYYKIKKIQKALGKDLKFVFRNFPITQIHPYALRASMAAEAAGDQGKFWEMHDILYENQNDLEDSAILKYATEISLNVSQFEDGINKNEHFQKIKEDFDSGIKVGIQGTPAFFINGKQYEGDWTNTDEFTKYLKSLK